MPYGKRKNSKGEWEVFNKDNGHVKGTHASEKEANDQLAALAIHVTKTAEVVLKSAAEQRVWGFAKISRVGGELVADAENDTITTEELSEAAYDFLQKSRAAKVTHGKDPQAGPGKMGELIESIVVTPEKLMAMGVPEDVAKTIPEGWFLGFDVHDAKTWSRVEAGELAAFSIGGSAIRQPVEEE